MKKPFTWNKPVVKPQECKSGAFHRRAKNFTKVKETKAFVEESKIFIEENKEKKK